MEAGERGESCPVSLESGDLKRGYMSWCTALKTSADRAIQDDEARWRTVSEDADAASGYEVRLSESKSISCWHMDHLSNILWTGGYPCITFDFLLCG